jgi:hypothetical protein
MFGFYYFKGSKFKSTLLYTSTFLSLVVLIIYQSVFAAQQSTAFLHFYGKTMGVSIYYPANWTKELSPDGMAVKFCTPNGCTSSIFVGRDSSVNTVEEAVNHTIQECMVGISGMPQTQPVCQVTKENILPIPFSNDRSAFLSMTRTFPSLNQTLSIFGYYVTTAHGIVYINSGIEKNMLQKYSPVVYEMFKTLRYNQTSG